MHGLAVRFTKFGTRYEIRNTSFRDPAYPTEMAALRSLDCSETPDWSSWFWRIESLKCGCLSSKTLKSDPGPYKTLRPI